MPPELTSLPTSLPTSFPANLLRFDLGDPLVRMIVILAVGLVVLVIVLRILGRLRAGWAAARLRAEWRRGREELQQQQEDIHKLAQQIEATSSTARIAGYLILRQVEAVCTDGRTSSSAALERLKALAAEKGANGIINVQTQQAPSGKWVASGDAVVLRTVERRDMPPRRG
jgi:hypothetical protein